jgi:pilus assembly protein CpaF
MENDVITMQDIFVFRRRGKSETGEILGDFSMTGIRPKFAEALQAAGVDMDPSNFRRDEVTA